MRSHAPPRERHHEREHQREHRLQATRPTPTDVEGHYLPLDDEGNVDFAPHREADEDDVEGHVLDLDIERKR